MVTFSCAHCMCYSNDTHHTLCAALCMFRCVLCRVYNNVNFRSILYTYNAPSVYNQNTPTISETRRYPRTRRFSHLSNMSGTSMNHGQSGTGTEHVNPAFVEDTKERIARNITNIILQQGDWENGLEPQQPQSKPKRSCGHCHRLLIFKEYERNGATHWSWCNRCAANQNRAADKRRAQKRANFKKWQHLFDAVISQMRSHSQEERSFPSSSSHTGGHLGPDQINLNPELLSRLFSARLACDICTHSTHLRSFIRKGKLWLTCNTCHARRQRRCVARMEERTETWDRALHSEIATVTIEDEVSSIQTIFDLETDYVPLPRQVVERFTSCDWRSINLLNYTPLEPSAPALHHALVNYTLTPVFSKSSIVGALSTLNKKPSEMTSSSKSFSS